MQKQFFFLKKNLAMMQIKKKVVEFVFGIFLFLIFFPFI
jgi:hypothetical protein